MKTFLPLLVLLAASTILAEQTVTFEAIVRYHEEVAGHSIKLVIHQRPYDFSKHQITGGVDNEGPAKIDGVEIAGTDGSSPKGWKDWPIFDAVVSMELEWDGQRIRVPRKLHLNLLNLGLERHSIQFVPRPSGEELLVQAFGGDGGGSYLTSIVLRKNGDHIQYPPIYWEAGLPEHPFHITRYLTGNGQVDSEVEEIPWLEPKAEQDGGGQPATRPESK